MIFKRSLLACTFISILLPLYSQKNKSKTDKERIATEEQFLAENFTLKSPSKWKPGEQFIYIEHKLNITIKPLHPILNDTTDYKNVIFTFDSFKEQTDWLGKSSLDLIFKTDNGKFKYETGKSLEQFSDTTYNPLIAGLIWLDEIERADSLFRGRKLYILTSEWLSDNESDLLKTRKFIPVEVTSVEPGNTHYPVRFNFVDEQGTSFSILSTLSGTLNSPSRMAFEKIFSFEDPKLKYKDIKEPNWVSITYGRINEGMTQQEVKLSIGKPTEIKRIPTYSGLKEQWFYNNGMMIFFEDGLVTKFRK